HVEIARTPDDDLPVHPKRKLASLVLARDEAQRKSRTVVHGDCAGHHAAVTDGTDSKILVAIIGHAQANARQSVAGSSSTTCSCGGRSAVATRRYTSSETTRLEWPRGTVIAFAPES